MDDYMPMTTDAAVQEWFSDNQVINTAVTVTTCISCILSLFGSSLIIGTFVGWQDLRSKPREILVYLSVADFMVALGYFYGTLKHYNNTSPDCVIQSTLTTFANLASLLWTVALSIYLYILIVQSSKRTADEGMLGFHILSWGIPLVVVIVANAENALGWGEIRGIAVSWCWISTDSSLAVMWILLTGKFWELCAYIILPVLYILIKIHISKQKSRYHTLSFQKQQTLDMVLRMDTKLMMIPFIFILLRIWSTVRVLLYLSNSPDLDNGVLLLLQGIGNSFQGAANCILFCFLTKKIRQRLLDKFCCGFYHQGEWSFSEVLDNETESEVSTEQRVSPMVANMTGASEHSNLLSKSLSKHLTPSYTA